MSKFLTAGQTVAALRPNDPLVTVINRLGEAPYPLLPVADGNGRLLGIVNLEEVHLASQKPSLQPIILAADLMRTDIRPLLPDDTLDRALELFVENDLSALPVVSDLKEQKVIGIVRRFEISTAYLPPYSRAGNRPQYPWRSSAPPVRGRPGAPRQNCEIRKTVERGPQGPGARGVPLSSLSQAAES